MRDRHTPECNPGNCDISGNEYVNRYRRRVSWRGRFGMWLLEKDLPLSFKVWLRFCKAWEQYQEVRQRQPYYNQHMWP